MKQQAQCNEQHVIGVQVQRGKSALRRIPKQVDQVDTQDRGNEDSQNRTVLEPLARFCAGFKIRAFAATRSTPVFFGGSGRLRPREP